MWKYPDEVSEFIAKNVAGKTVNELTTLTNKIMGTEFTCSKMHAYLTNHCLRTGTKGGKPKGYSRVYTPEVKQFISDNYKGTGHQAMADLLNERFGTNYTKEQIKGYYARFKLDSGLTGQFKRGQVPVNKGTKGMFNVGGNKTSYKKGNRSFNRVPLGSERITKDGYIQTKIQDGKLQHNWRGKHILIWEKHNGPLPDGHAIIFGDGNNRNFDINNLICVSRSQLARLNQNGLIQNDADLTRTGVAIADVLHKIAEAKKRS